MKLLLLIENISKAWCKTIVRSTCYIKKVVTIVLHLPLDLLIEYCLVPYYSFYSSTSHACTTCVVCCLQKYFNDEYYGLGEGEDVKPQFEMSDDDLDMGMFCRYCSLRCPMMI